jgi:hypothetical protein
MNDPHPSDRPRYQPSGQLAGQSFLAAALVTLLASACFSVLLYLVYRGGIYFILLTPLLVALPLAGLISWTVRSSHCRNPWLAACLAGVAALIFYLGYFHTGLIWQIGLDNTHRLDLLPRYIKMRMETDVVRDAARPNPQAVPQQPNDIQTVVNWVMFATELGIVGAMLIGVGWGTARKPYSEETGQWMSEESATLPPGSGPILVQALNDGTFAEAAAQATPEARAAPPYTTVTLYYGKDQDQKPLFPVYCTIKEATGWRNRALLDRVRLSPVETAQLANLFPSLTAAGTSPDAAAVAEITPADRTHGQIRKVEGPFQGRVFTPLNHWIANSFLVLPMAAFFILGGGGLVVMNTNRQVGPWPGETAGFFLMGAGAVFFCAAYLVLRRFPLHEFYYRWQARKELRLRGDCLVSPDDPDALFVNVTPRENWRKLKLQLSTDVGFLRIDGEQRRLLFEGDSERYEIPAEAILACDVEARKPLEQNNSHAHPDPFYYTVVRVRLADRIAEIPFFPNRGSFGSRWGMSNYYPYAEELQRRILELTGALPSGVQRLG